MQPILLRPLLLLGGWTLRREPRQNDLKTMDTNCYCMTVVAPRSEGDRCTETPRVYHGRRRWSVFLLQNLAVPCDVLMLLLQQRSEPDNRWKCNRQTTLLLAPFFMPCQRNQQAGELNSTLIHIIRCSSLS